MRSRIAREALWRWIFGAVAAVALLILPLAHQPLAGAGHGPQAGAHHHHQASVTTAGTPAKAEKHTSCHACRITAAALPPPPYPLAATHDGSTAVVYWTSVERPVLGALLSPHNPRAPPIEA